MAISDGNSPNVDNISFRNGPARVTGGTATGSEAIIADVGTPSVGSIYISSAGSGEIWNLNKKSTTQAVWTQVTVP